ncbi:MAG: tyrosine-type recombinase/integrase [Sneathiella sp.]
MNSGHNHAFQSVLAGHINEFLTAKRALGKHFVCEEKVLRLLDHYLIEQQVEALEHITPELVESFLASRPRHSSKSYNQLLSTVRRLFDWLELHKRISHSPVRVPPRRVTSSRVPFIFNADQARSLLDIAAQLPNRSTAPNRGATYRMIFAFLYGLGLRVGEVARLQIRDVDFRRDLLIIRETKFSKTRLVPFGPRLCAALKDYIRQQTEQYGALALEQPVFSFSRATARPINPNTISWTFHQLVSGLALDIPPGVSSPHLHCLRHSFAVGTLLHWYRTGIDPSRRLIHLSTFMGHVCPSSTAVYLTITPELLQCANQRFEQCAAPILMEAKP